MYRTTFPNAPTFRFISPPSAHLLLLENEAPAEIGTGTTLFRKVDDQFLGCMRLAPDEPDAIAACANAPDLDGPAIQSPRRLGARTIEILKVSRRVIEIQDSAGSRGAAILFDPLQGEY